VVVGCSNIEGGGVEEAKGCSSTALTWEWFCRAAEPGALACAQYLCHLLVQAAPVHCRDGGRHAAATAVASLCGSSMPNQCLS
jgi:hypothetical protein